MAAKLPRRLGLVVFFIAAKLRPSELGLDAPMAPSVDFNVDFLFGVAAPSLFNVFLICILFVGE